MKTKLSFSFKVKVIQEVLKGKLETSQAEGLLECSSRTLRRYKSKFMSEGPEGLKDKRHSNYQKLTKEQKFSLIQKKKEGPWRSARWIRDHLNLPVHEVTVWRTLGDLNHLNADQVKPIIRFEAQYPNELWQTDIMGKIYFPKIGKADYQYYARLLGIKLIFAHQAQTKGKIERFWRFVQSDFVPGVWEAKTMEEINGKFKLWLAAYNYKFRSEYFDNKTRADRYEPSERRIKRVELETLLLIEERRKVTRQSTISLYGKQYFVPPGYINCRIWVKIIGNQILFEANGKIFWKTRLRLS